MSLILGIGMCLSMGGLGNGEYFGLGVVIGIIGIIGVCANYFIYKKILKSSKEKYASDIIRLANEISQMEK